MNDRKIILIVGVGSLLSLAIGLRVVMKLTAEPLPQPTSQSPQPTSQSPQPNPSIPRQSTTETPKQQATPPKNVPPVKETAEQYYDRVREKTDTFSSFRGIKWGTDLRQMSDMVLVDRQPQTLDVNLTDDIKVSIDNVHDRTYKRNGEKLVLGDIALEEIVYDTFDGRLYGVRMTCRRVDRFEELRGVFAERYGRSQE